MCAVVSKIKAYQVSSRYLDKCDPLSWVSSFKNFDIDSCDLQWLDVFCVLEIILNGNCRNNYKCQFISSDLYMIWKSKKWRLSTYITLILVISFIGKIVGFRFYFIVEIAILTKNIRGITYYFPTYHMIQSFISGKVIILFYWRINLFYIKYFLLINFEVLNRNKLIYDM